jgi:hypothetical protein
MEDHFSLLRVVRCVLGLVAAAGPGSERSEGEWDRMRAAIFRALRPFEEARRAVWEALAPFCPAPEGSPA